MTALDTAYNYQRFDAHCALADAAGNLLDRFDVSTKVGFFPGGHDLEPVRLRAAVEQATRELGRAPDTVLLHNPECSPRGFDDACATLTALRDSGLCRAWGLSSWDPRPLASIVHAARPDVLMVRAGLTVPTAVLDAAEQLSLTLEPTHVWGMAPFGGHGTDPIWTSVDATQFLMPGQDPSRLQAALAAAFAIPPVERIAVGTSRPEHLTELVAARALAINLRHIASYRDLLRRHASVSVGS